MRADRVLAMAESRFGRSFASKGAAIDALSKLPPSEQRRLRKPAAPKPTAAINAAIDKVAGPRKALPAVGPLPRSVRLDKALADSVATTAAASRKPRAPKSNPALVRDLAGKVNAALKGGSPDLIATTREELAAAKLSKADSHALAKALDQPVPKSTTGKEALSRIQVRLNTMADFVLKSRHMAGRTAAALGPMVLPVVAGGAAVLTMSDAAQAGETAGKVVVKGSKAAADVVSGGALSEYDAAKARGAGTAEAVATGAFKGAVNVATFGLADAANQAAKEQGGFAGVVSDVVTAAAKKVGDALGRSNEVRKGSADGDVPGLSGTAVAGTVLAGIGLAKVTDPIKPGRGGKTLIVTGVALLVKAAADHAAAKRGEAQAPGAFLNEAAERKAAAVDRAPKPVVVAPEQRTDGRTEGYTRRGPNGQVVRVQGYRTPDRRQ